MRSALMFVTVLIAAPSSAQAPGTVSHTVDVTGHAKVSVPPDTANIHYWLRGEGKTSDEAVQAMVDAQSRVETGLKSLLGQGSEITNSDLVVIEVRDPNCKNDTGRAVLSEGNCAIVGYVASSQADVRTPNIDESGTAAGLASRLGARDARLLGFELRNPASAQQAAMARAVEDARQEAQVLASASGGHLGRVVNIQYGSYLARSLPRVPITVNAPPPPPPPPPIEIHMKPRAQEVTADVSVTFELLP